MIAAEREPETDLGEALSPELFQKIKAIQLRTQRLVTDVMAGEYESAFKGRGMEFVEVREYQAGDDVRHIDWNVTARTGAPYVKEHHEERELTVMLLVDLSSSGAFGSGERLKNEVAAEIAAVLAYTAIRSNDRVGLVLFTDRIERFIPPKKGRAHVWRVIREILSFRPQRRATDLAGALEFLGKVARRRVVAFLVSDFLDDGYAERLAVAARRHDLTAITITDRRETRLPGIGLIELEDAETGEILLVDTSDGELARDFAALAGERRRRTSELFRATGVGEIGIWTDEPWIDTLIRFFRRRERHLYR